MGIYLCLYRFSGRYGKYLVIPNKSIIVWRRFISDTIFYICNTDRSTGVIGEMSFGRAAKAGPIDAFGIACEKKGKRKVGEALGMIPVFGSLAMAIGYTVVMGWILRYAVGTFTGATLSPENVDEFGAAFGKMASAFGNNIWQILALVACMLILMLGVGSGIEKANKIMMPIFFALFVILGIYVGFQPGASEGYRYIFRVDPEAFKDPATWIFALGQAFFSLSVAGNGTLIYGSYLSDEEDIPASAGRVALFDTIAAILAALVTFRRWQQRERSWIREVPDFSLSSFRI